MCLMENQTMEYIDFYYDVKIYHKNVFNHIHLTFMNEHICIKHFSFHHLMINKTIFKEENVEPILNKYFFNIYHDHHFDHKTFYINVLIFQSFLFTQSMLSRCILKKGFFKDWCDHFLERKNISICPFVTYDFSLDKMKIKTYLVENLILDLLEHKNHLILECSCILVHGMIIQSYIIIL